MTSTAIAAEKVIFAVTRIAPRSFGGRCRCLAAAALIVLLMPAAAAAADPPAATTDGAQNAVAQFRKTLTDILSEETAALDLLKGNITQEKERAASVSATAVAYRLDSTAAKNLLLSAETPIDGLDEAWNRLQIAAAGFGESLAALEKQSVLLVARHEQTEAQVAQYRMQLADLRAAGGPLPKDLTADANRLLKLLMAKGALLDAYQDLMAAQIATLTEIREDALATARRFEQRIRKSKSQDRFARRDRVDLTAALPRLTEDLQRMSAQIRTLSSDAFWLGELTGLWRLTGFALISFLLSAVAWLVVLVRLRRWLGGLIQRASAADFPALVFALHLFRRHVVAAGMAAALLACLQIDVVYFSLPSLQYIVGLMGLWVFTGWGLAAVAEAGRHVSAAAWRGVLRRCAWMLRLIQSVGVVSIGLHWCLAEGEHLLITVVRIAFEMVFLWWALSLGRCIRRLPEDAADSIGLKWGPWKPVATGLLAVVGLAGLIIDVAGYGRLARHWYLSMGRSAGVLLWVVVVFLVLRQWEAARRRRAAAADNPMRSPIEYLAIVVAVLGGLLGGALLLILSWGGGAPVIANLLAIFRMPLSAGSLHFSLLSMMSAVAILLLTHVATRIWRPLLQVRLLSRSGMESGLQASITTVSAYLIWGLGILIALNLFGLDSTSMALAFGAVGIGLGFGLQNIFSNFVSGLILLFERPIQVGDDVEIDGVWATVRKINVRATIVQTYDNASLIIPNADFISKQVTNWSFKDRRVRRRVDVGVAYGSDLDAVRDTLLEIAAATDNVIAQPKPDVLFVDFGDSALLFRLRFWTDVDQMLRVETAVRFAIDRRFRERGIEIAFPQQDIHIRTGLPLFPGAPAPDPPPPGD